MKKKKNYSWIWIILILLIFGFLAILFFTDLININFQSILNDTDNSTGGGGTSNTVICVDSDGGLIKTTPGNVNYDGIRYYDKCVFLDYDLIEFTCLNGRLIENHVMCEPNQECIETRSGGYCEDIPGFSNGDTIVSDSNSGTSSDDVNNWEISLGSGTGTCGAGALISTSWDYASPECQGIQGMEGIIWNFYDSYGLQYTRVDSAPVGLGIDTGCVLSYDGETPFLLSMNKAMGIPGCQIDYTWDVIVYACNCDPQ